MKIVNRSRLHSIALSLLYIVVFTIVVLFSWNSFATDLFQLPAMKMKQALSLVLFIGCVSVLLRLSGNQVSRHDHSYCERALRK